MLNEKAQKILRLSKELNRLCAAERIPYVLAIDFNGSTCRGAYGDLDNTCKLIGVTMAQTSLSTGEPLDDITAYSGAAADIAYRHYQERKSG